MEEKFFEINLMPVIQNNIITAVSLPFDRYELNKYLLDRIASYGSRVLMVDSVTGKCLTATEIVDIVATLAKKLKDEYNVGAGYVVGICSENSLEYVLIIYAVLACGGTVAPCSHLYTHGELVHNLRITQPKILFCSEAVSSRVLKAAQEVGSVKHWFLISEKRIDGYLPFNSLLQNKISYNNFTCADVNPEDDVAFLLCSSGTTGLPKCVELTYKNVSADAAGLRAHYSWRRWRTVVFFLPFYHGYGIVAILNFHFLGTKTVILPKFSEIEFFENVQKHRAEILMIVPPIALLLAKHPLLPNYDFTSVREIHSGAAPLSLELITTACERIGVPRFEQGYGLTEGGVACACSILHPVKSDSVGLTLPGLQCKVIDVETKIALPPHTTGELCFRGLSVMKGYHRNPESTRETIDSEGWLHSGDVGYYDEEGFIYIVSRIKELIKVKGFQVSPTELEAILLRHGKIQDAAVIGIPDEESGELPLAFVVLFDEKDLTEKDIQDYIKDLVSPHKRLKGGVCFIDKIPKSGSGKILRRELLKMYENGIYTKL